MNKRYLIVFLFIIVTAAQGQSGSDSSALKKKDLQKDTTAHDLSNRSKEIKKQVAAPVNEVKESALQNVKSSPLHSNMPFKKEAVNEEIRKKISSEKTALSPEADTTIIRNSERGISNEVTNIKERAGTVTDTELSPKRVKEEAAKVSDEVKKSGEQNKQKVSKQVDGGKNKIKTAATELKKPADFDLTMDNNGAKGNSQQLQNIEQTLDGLKDFKLDPGNVAAPQVKVPAIASPAFSLPKNTFPKASASPKMPQKMGDVDEVLKQYKKPSTMKNLAGAYGASMPDARTILSERYLQKLKDSIGGKKFDSIYNKTASLVRKKEIGKEDLLAAINNPAISKAQGDQSKLTESQMKDSMKGELADQTKGFDPRSGKLPQEVLEKLPPLSGNVIDSKYLKIIDSLRSKKLSQQDLKLMEKKAGDDYKEVVLKKKPTFADKSYFDGVLGLLSNENATIVQVSPSLGYHLLPLVSVGIGPVISIRKENKLINSTIGVRSFLKAELFKQRGYLQVEHQMNGYAVNYKMFKAERGSVLAGGGVVKKLYGKIALNLSLLYRINNDKELHLSPWVFRLGISTIGSKKTN